MHVNVIRFSHTKFQSWHFVFFELSASLPSCGTCQWRAQLRTSSAEHVISWAGAISARDWGLLTGESIDGHLDRGNYFMCEWFRWVDWWKNALDGWKDGQIVVWVGAPSICCRKDRWIYTGRTCNASYTSGTLVSDIVRLVKWDMNFAKDDRSCAGRRVSPCSC